MRIRLRICSAALCLGFCFVSAFANATAWAAASNRGETVDWPVYGGQLASDHYSALTQINRQNVSKLRRAWIYDTGEKGALETSPLVIGHILYAYSSTQKVIALDATTGKLLWKFDSGIAASGPMRGLAYWANGKQSRLLAGVMNFLYALDPITGKPISSFGENGRIDLRKGLGRDYRFESLAITTPGVVYKNLIIMGAMEPETHPAPLGDIRAFDVRTGALVWRFHTIPRPGEFGYDTWPKGAWKTAGSANNWAGMSDGHEDEASSTCRPGPRCSIFMAEIASAMIYSPTRCSHSMPTPENAFGIFKACITTSGIAIFLHPPRW